MSKPYLRTVLCFLLAALFVVPALAQETVSLNGGSVCADGSTLYTLNMKGLFAYSTETGDTKSLASASRLSVSTEAMLLYGDALMILDPHRKYGANITKLWRFENGSLSLVCDLKGTVLDDPDLRIDEALFLENCLYARVAGPSNSYADGYVVKYDLKSERAERLPLYGCMELSHYRDGKLLAMLYLGAEKQVVSYDTRSGAKEQLFTLGGIRDEGVRYSLKDDAIYGYVDGALRRWDGAQWTLCSRIAPSFNIHDFALVGDWYAAINTSEITLYPIRGTDAGKTLLTIRGAVDANGWDSLFQQDHPDVAVERRTDAHFCAEELFLAVQTGDKTDLFAISLGAGFARLVDKGYVADLSSSEALRRDHARLYPSIADPLTRGEQFYAFASSFMPTAWIMRSDAGLTAPTTLRELLEAQEAWEQSAEYDGTPYVAPSYATAPWGAKEYADFLLRHYILEKGTGSDPLSFDDPDFRDTLEAIASYGQRAQLTEASGVIGNAGLLTADASINSNGSRVFQNAQMILTPTVLRGAEPHAAAYMTIYVLNPLSENKELAISYLEAAAARRADSDSALLCQDAEHSVLQSRDAAMLDEIRTERAGVVEALASASDSKKQELEESIRLYDYRENKLLSSPNSYVVYQPWIEQYMTYVAPYIDFGLDPFLSSSAHARVYGDMRAVIEQYLSGALSLDDCVRRLNSVCEMAYLENDGR